MSFGKNSFINGNGARGSRRSDKHEYQDPRGKDATNRAIMRIAQRTLGRRCRRNSSRVFPRRIQRLMDYRSADFSPAV